MFLHTAEQLAGDEVMFQSVGDNTEGSEVHHALRGLKETQSSQIIRWWN